MSKILCDSMFSSDGIHIGVLMLRVLLERFFAQMRKNVQRYKI